MRHGFIRDQIDIKYLILYSLSFFPIAIKEGPLLEVVMIDDGFGYFEFAEAFSFLREANYVGQVQVDGEFEYFLNPSGIDLMNKLNMMLPFSVREKAEKAAMRVLRQIRRDSTIKTSHRKNEDGTFTVELKIVDKSTEHLSIEMLMVTERQCAIISNNFKARAEIIYKEMLNLVSQDPQVT